MTLSYFDYRVNRNPPRPLQTSGPVTFPAIELLNTKVKSRVILTGSADSRSSIRFDPERREEFEEIFKIQINLIILPWLVDGILSNDWVSMS